MNFFVVVWSDIENFMQVDCKTDVRGAAWV